MSKFAPHRPSNNRPKATSTTICQKCLGTGHYIFECKSTRPYVSRPSRTEVLENPKLLAKLRAEGKPSVEVPEEFRRKSGTANRILEEKELERKALEQSSRGKAKEEDESTRKKATRSSSSDNSDSESDSGSSSSDSSDSASDSSTSRSDSRERSRKRLRRHRSSSISESSTRSSESRS